MEIFDRLRRMEALIHDERERAVKLDLLNRSEIAMTKANLDHLNREIKGIRESLNQATETVSAQYEEHA